MLYRIGVFLRLALVYRNCSHGMECCKAVDTTEQVLSNH